MGKVPLAINPGQLPAGRSGRIGGRRLETPRPVCPTGPGRADRL